MYNCSCNIVFLLSEFSIKGFECLVYKKMFCPFSQNCQRQWGIFTFSVLIVQVTLDIGAKAVTGNNWMKLSGIAISPLDSSRLQTYSIMFCVPKTPHCSDSLVSMACKQYPLFFMTSVFAPVTSSHDNFMVITKLMFLICQHRYILLPKTAEPCARERLLSMWKVFKILPKLQKQDIMDNLILNLWIGFELERYPDLNSALFP